MGGVGLAQIKNKVFLVIFTSLVHFHIALWERFGHFSDIFGIRWDFLGGTPAIYFADFGAILAIFGPLLGRKKRSFFAGKWLFGPGIRARGHVDAWGIFV